VSQSLPEQITPTKSKKTPLGLNIIHSPHLGLVVSILIIIKLVGSVIFSLLQDSTIRTDNYSESLVDFDGAIGKAEFTRDGSAIIFTAKAKSSTKYQIYLKTLTNDDSQLFFNQTAQLLSNKDDHYWLVSRAPLSDRIAYLRKNNSICGIYVATVITSPRLLQTTQQQSSHLQDEQKVFSCDQQQTHNLDWSHDEASLYFSAKTKPSQETLFSSVHPGYALYRYDFNSKVITRLSGLNQVGEDEHLLSASSDGQWLAYVRSKSQMRWQYYLSNLATGEQKLLLDTGMHTNGISWSNDDKNLLVATSDGPKLISLSGSVNDLIFDQESSYTLDAEFSANGTKIAINSLKSEADLWRHPNPLTSNKQANITQMTPRSNQALFKNRKNFLPAYANTSHRLAYVSYRNSRTEIMLLDENGAEIQLTYQAPYDFSLTQLQWSRDDSQIMFSANNAIYLLTIDSRVITRITDKKYDIDTPSWSAEGSHIYFSSNKDGNWQIWRVDREGNNLTRMTHQSGASARESTDGATLYFSKYGEVGLWQKKLDVSSSAVVTNKETLLIPDFSIYAHVSWKVFDTGIYYHSFNNNQSAINYWDFNNMSAQTLIEKADKDINCSQFSVAKDQQKIAILHNTFQTELKVLTLEK